MQMNEDIIKIDAILLGLYKTLQKSTIPVDQAKLRKKIDEALDKRLVLMKAEKEDDLATW